MQLTDRTKARISLSILFFALEAGIYLIAKIAPSLRMDPFTWLLLVFAAAMGGAGIAYLGIGDWIRWPLTREVPHSSNASMVEIEPKYQGWLNSPGLLLCCPICAGTWVGVGLLGLLALNYSLGYYTILALSVAGAARVVIRLSELLEWQSRYAQERTADLNRRNAQAEQQKEFQRYLPVDQGEAYWVVKEDQETR